MDRAVDPITFQVIKNSLLAAAEEMQIVLAKTAYSPILKLGGDYSCGIFDASGNMVAQSLGIPSHLGSMPLAVKAVLASIDSFAPGDVILHNDPYFGGTHLPDINVVTPIFLDDDVLLGSTSVRAHGPAVGSASPGSYGATTEIYGEGLRLPVVHLYTAGKLNQDIENVVWANVRTPEERRGDLRAQVAANRRGTIRVRELAHKYGPDLIKYMMQGIQDYSESMMQAQLERLEDGEFYFEDYLDGDGIVGIGETEDQVIHLSISVSKKGNQMTVDFSGSEAQVPGPMNAPLAVTATGVYTAVKMMVDPTDLIPANSGAWRPVKVTAPEGSVFNALAPAPVVFANHEMTYRICDMLFGAVASGYPQNVQACSQGTSALLAFGGVDPKAKGRYVNVETVAGGFGARPNQDGINSIKAGTGNTMNTPVEELEARYPVEIERYEIIPDSGGAGKYRGGSAARRVWRILDHTATASVCCEHLKFAPFGLLGGLSGSPGRIDLVDQEDHRRPIMGKGPSFAVPPGHRIWYESPGSGGYGDPRAWHREMLRSDVVNGYVSEESAVRDYGSDGTDGLRCPDCLRIEENRR